jgi:peptidoglycan/LPS O-acetylase OafA/YrhL
MTHLPALDGLRAAAALWIVAFHATGFIATSLPIVRHGYIAVDLFFMLSGFVLAHVYAPVFARDGFSFYARYLCRRVARLWPAWLVVLALFAFKAELAQWSGLGSGSLRVVDDPGTWALSALLMQSWGWSDPERINPPGWSLSYEWAASLLLPLALALAVRLRAAMLCVVLALLCLLAHALYTHLHGLPSLHTAAAHGGARVAAGFFVGVLLWRAWQAQPPDHRIAPACLLLAVVVMLAFGPGRWADHLLILLGAGVLFGVATGQGRLAAWLSTPMLRAIGDASYALYVVHWLVFEILWWVFNRLGLKIGAPLSWAFVAAMIVLSLAAAFPLHALVERPARRALRRLAEAEPAR